MTALRYEELSDSDKPFHCPTCTAMEQQQTILELHRTVTSLQEEVKKMQIAINALQEKDAANTLSLSDDVSELKAIVALLQVSRAENPSASKLPDNTQPWCEVVRRKPPHSGGKGKGERGKNGKGGRGKNGKGGSEQGEMKQPKEHGVPNHNGPSQSKGKTARHQNQSPRQFRSLPGKRKVWGTRKACSSDTVKDTISKLVSTKVAVVVKRKYKLVNGNKTVKWWHVLRGDEETMALLEKEWSKVKEQTSWSIEPCLEFEVNTQVLSPDLDENSIVTRNEPGDGKSHTSQAAIQPPTMDMIQPSNNTDASPSSAPTMDTIEPSNNTDASPSSAQNTNGRADLTQN